MALETVPRPERQNVVCYEDLGPEQKIDCMH